MNRKIHIQTFNKQDVPVNWIEIDEVVLTCMQYDNDVYSVYATDNKRYAKMRVNKLIIDDLMEGSTFYIEWMYSTVMNMFNKIEQK